jgi:protein KRI1
MSKSLLDDDESSTQITINERFASKYEHRKQREELSQLQDKYSESESEGEPEDEVGELVTPALDAQIVKTIALIREKDPSVYDSSKQFFSQDEIDTAKKDWVDKKRLEQKPLKLKDYHRKNLLEKGGTYLGEEDEPEMSFAQEQELAKWELKRAAEMDSDDDLFTVRKKTDVDLEAEEADYKEFLLGKMASESKETAQAIRDWTNRKVDNLGEGAKLEDKEAFLWDFILSRGWMDKEEKRNQEDDLSADEEDVDAQEDFERRHNFRYEEEGAAQIIGHARDVEGTLRRKDDRRKEARERKKTREEENKIRKGEELKRLKNLKKKEILDKMKQIQDISGAKALGFEDVDLDAEFDPEEYDKQMAQTFGDDYYEEVDADGKPIFNDDVDIREFFNEPTEPAPQVDVQIEQEHQEPKNSKKKDKKKKKAPKEEEFIMDADFLPDGPRHGQEPAKLPKPKGEQLNKMLDEMHQLDYEDIVGGQPVRFKYTQVKPDYHGLEPWQILLADDKDLNDIYSIKKIAPYRAGDKEKRDKHKWSREKNKSTFFLPRWLTRVRIARS